MLSEDGFLPSYHMRQNDTDSEGLSSVSTSVASLTNAAVVIVGGGISGMCMAIDLLVHRKLENFVILEQSGGFGGTWRDNKYPGCCCDVFSVLYSYSFAQNPSWSRRYPGQSEILDYLTDVAQKYGLYKYARFHSSVEEAHWNDKTHEWEVSVSLGGGKDAEFTPSYKITCDYLVTATGQLNKPKGLDAPGYDTYRGKIMHSARWDWSYNLKNKRIAIIGTGATTAQTVPEIAKVASKLTICQRTPAWVIPRHDSSIPPWQKAMFTYLPAARQRARAEAMDLREAFHAAVTKSDSTYAELMKSMNHSLLREQLPDRPDLWEKLTPTYEPGCKRTVISDDYYPTLLRKNVELQTDRIDHFKAHGIKFQGHDEAESFDLIILATGFDTFSFLSPIKISGRNGRPLEEIWSHAAYAYRGIAVPDLPNFGMMYGPNTNLTHNSLILVIEAQTRYISVLIDKVLQARQSGHSLALCPSEEKALGYWQELQSVLQRTSFSDPNCNSWWKRDDGIITNNWVGTAVDYQKSLSKIAWSDFQASGSAGNEIDRLGRTGTITNIERVVEETKLSRTAVGVVLLGVVGMLVQTIAKKLY